MKKIVANRKYLTFNGTYIFAIMFLAGIASTGCRSASVASPYKVEIVLNDTKLPLSDSLVANFIKDFNNAKKLPYPRSVVYTSDLNIYYKDSMASFQSDGSIYVTKAGSVTPKIDLLKKYWNLDEENIWQTGSLIESVK